MYHNFTVLQIGFFLFKKLFLEWFCVDETIFYSFIQAQTSGLSVFYYISILKLF